VKKKSPEKSFTATDRYTIKLPGGKRDLTIENTLSGIENDFVNVLSRIRRRQNLNLPDRARLCLFVAAMHTRTIAMGEHWRKRKRIFTTWSSRWKKPMGGADQVDSDSGISGEGPSTYDRNGN
jgi:hypothetical protein